jgi:hypothetical protein
LGVRAWSVPIPVSSKARPKKAGLKTLLQQLAAPSFRTSRRLPVVCLVRKAATVRAAAARVLVLTENHQNTKEFYIYAIAEALDIDSG